MSKKESLRIVPLSAAAIAAFGILIVFEVLVIGGVFELKASTVARIAPWAYEPFLRIVGEHPESETLKGSVSAPAGKGAGAPSGMASIADFDAEGVTIDTDAKPEEGIEVGTGGLVPEAIPTNAVPAASPQMNSIPDRSAEVVPVG